MTSVALEVFGKEVFEKNFCKVRIKEKIYVKYINNKNQLNWLFIFLSEYTFHIFL